MKDLRSLLPTAADVLRLSQHELAGYLLEAHNADSVNVKQHPKNIRNAVVGTWYHGPDEAAVAARIIGALDLLMRDGYIVRTYDDIDPEWFVATEKGRAVRQHEDIFTPVELPLTQKPLVFISCGQLFEEEKRVGRELAKLIEKHTDCDAYFAQNQNSLESLSNNILGALAHCVALVVVMHKRGTVTYPGGSNVRGSVWIEQEIAMAALLKHFFNQDITVQAYVEKGIEREGLRGLLHLNETEFSTNADFLQDFEERLTSGRFRPRASSTEKGGRTSDEPAADEERTEIYVRQAAELVSDAHGQAGLMIPSYLCAYRLIIHPLVYRPELIPEERERDVVSNARHLAGGHFPIDGPERAVNLEDGFEVRTTLERMGGRPEHREFYTFRRSGLFVWVRASPDDIDDDRQYRGNDRYISFARLVTTIKSMAYFATILVKSFSADARAQIVVASLQNHVLRDDTGSSGLPPGTFPVAHQERVATECSGAAAYFEASVDEWIQDTAAKCLRALNVPMTLAVAKRAVHDYLRRQA